MPFTLSASEKLIKLSGSIGIADAIALRESLLVKLAAMPSCPLDFGGVDVCDTAGLQLLCALALDHKKQNKMISVSRWASAITDAALVLGVKLDSLFTTVQE